MVRERRCCRPIVDRLRHHHLTVLGGSTLMTSTVTATLTSFQPSLTMTPSPGPRTTVPMTRHGPPPSSPRRQAMDETSTSRTWTVTVILTLLRHRWTITRFPGTRTMARMTPHGLLQTSIRILTGRLASTLMIWTTMATLTSSSARLLTTPSPGTKTTVPPTRHGRNLRLTRPQTVHVTCMWVTWTVTVIWTSFQRRR